VVVVVGGVWSLNSTLAVASTGSPSTRYAASVSRSNSPSSSVSWTTVAVNSPSVAAARGISTWGWAAPAAKWSLTPTTRPDSLRTTTNPPSVVTSPTW